MTNKVMAFGTRQYAGWIKAPRPKTNHDLKRFSSQRQLPNGQISIATSEDVTKVFTLTFKGPEADVAGIRDWIYRRYADPPYLFNHPQAILGNMLPRHWSQFQNAVKGRGNKALDLYSAPVSFSGTLAQNPNLAAVSLTGATGLPANGAKLWSPNSTAPVWPPVAGSRPFQSILIPPNYGGRLTVWGSQNTTNSPGIYYAVSTVGPSNTVLGSGTLLKPVTSGATASIALDASNWRVVDIWIGAGAATTNTEWTIFGAMDFRIAYAGVPALPGVWEPGRGQYPVRIGNDTTQVVPSFIGPTDTQTLYELTAEFTEVAQPW